MAIQVTAKRNKLVIPGAYLMVASVTMQKYFKPSAVVNPETGKFDTTPALMCIGRAQLYYDREERLSTSGQSVAAFTFNVNHANGADPVHECYAHIHANGVEGWVLNDMVDILVDPPL